MTALLDVAGLVKHFPIRTGLLGRRSASVRAVDGITFDVREGETLGVVGESGCGKSTTARLLMGLIPADAGRIMVGNRSLGTTLTLADLRRDVQMVFQDSYASLNPRLTIEDTIAFGPKCHGMADNEARALARSLLSDVGLEPARFLGRYPHELSGGQRQRVNIARALALKPRILILDEAVSALDKSVEAQVLNLLCDLRQTYRLTYIFISHDLGVVRYMADRIMVVYLGEIVEIGAVEDVYAQPQHPYTRALLSAMPSMDPDRRTTVAPLSGDPPNPVNPPGGCRFHPRCAFAEKGCATTVPSLTKTAARGHLAACHMLDRSSGHTKAKGVG